MSDTKKAPPGGEWFAEYGNDNSNKALAAALADQGLGYDLCAICQDVPCNDGKRRTMYRLPSKFVRMILKAEEGSDVLKFRFWKRNGPDALAYPMDFIKQKPTHRKKKFRSAAERLKEIWAANHDGQASTDEPPF